ncbi:DUF2304 domain-containing protein [Lachnospiraceae bacterium 50-23]|jgi:hypothetical protein|nr:DUF2304 domain-containing protein [Dorea sp.]GFI36506.1 hypothetical protein IMSAGC015_00667 [Lachnospiraceae bacterium]
MSGFLRILLVIGAVLLMIFMVRRIRQSKLKIEYSIFWIIFSGVLVVMGSFPQFFYVVSKLLGFQSPINMIYLVIIFILIMKLFLMSIQISDLETKVDSLVQQIAIDEKLDLDDREKELSGE